MTMRLRPEIIRKYTGIQTRSTCDGRRFSTVRSRRWSKSSLADLGSTIWLCRSGPDADGILIGCGNRSRPRQWLPENRKFRFSKGRFFPDMLITGSPSIGLDCLSWESFSEGIPGVCKLFLEVRTAPNRRFSAGSAYLGAIGRTDLIRTAGLGHVLRPAQPDVCDQSGRGCQGRGERLRDQPPARDGPLGLRSWRDGAP